MLNAVFIEGNLIKDYIGAEKIGSNNKTYIQFVLAVNLAKNSPVPMFISCSAFEKTALYLSNKLKKGARVAVQGYLNPKIVNGKQNGTSVIVSNVISISGQVEQTLGDELISIPEGEEDIPVVDDDSGLPF